MKRVLLIFCLILPLGAAEKDGSEKKQRLPQKGDIRTVGGMKFVYVPAVKFRMGSDASIARPDEKPAHNVSLHGFWIGMYEVTQKQYKAIMGNNPSYFKGDDFPVERVSWSDANDFCSRFMQLYKVRSRLPSEAEWEYAAGGGDGRNFFWGDRVDPEYTWYSANSERSTHPVGRKKPNYFGLYDTAGNVAEWCIDRYDSAYYEKGVSMNPYGAEKGEFRVVRGGSYASDYSAIRTSARYSMAPDYRVSLFGFRVVIYDDTE